MPGQPALRAMLVDGSLVASLVKRTGLLVRSLVRSLVKTLVRKRWCTSEPANQEEKRRRTLDALLRRASSVRT